MALATGHSPEDAMDRIEEIFVRKRAMRRFTVPVFSLLDHTVFDRELAAAYAGCDIADLPVNAYAVSTNLTRSSLHVHRSGPVWQAVRSSGAIPGALPPFATDNGELLVDGALVDNLPVSVMRDLKIGPNVLAGFFEDETRHRPADYQSVPGRERLLADLVLRRKRAFPGLLNVLSRAMLVTSRRSLRETEIGSDLLVHLPARERMGLLEWQSGRAQEELCYRYVTDLIEAAGGPDALIAQGAGPH
jgi:NTE family protein